ncbi:MAG TPA: hypothetical protein DDX98_03050 [Bacteroidales bacterium]|jgi:beta-galactosidase|nr:hypothetical protein [Bacteroidales bacterium]
MTFSVKEDNFYFNDKKVFLNSGEIHYFRIRRDQWDTHLLAAKEAGLTTVSSYVPWAIHEPEEGVFDFHGTTSPERDLKGWLERCKAFGLHCVVKPGPFILAEYRGAGLPDWFMDRYGKEVKMRNSAGNIFQSDGVSLFNHNYLEKVTSWYDKIMPFIAEHQLSSGGPIIMMQICNEIGVFTWLAHQADYCSNVKERFVAYVQKRYSDINELNSLWGTDYEAFGSVELPPDGNLPYASREDRGRDYEWHCFWRIYYGEYLKMLTEMARERGVSVPFYHNLPGWIYGSGYEFPVNITMYEELYGNKSDIIFGVDHIPEFMSYRNMHDDRIINDITNAMQGKKPLFAAEFQSGSREYHVVTSPQEMELFYKASVSNGLTGWNYYMFSQGKNTRHTGYSGSTFYWFTPLTNDGQRTNAFPLVKRMSNIIKTTESIILEAKRRAEICVLFYPPYYSTELERPVSAACELQFDFSAIRRGAYFDGLLKVLQVLNIDYDMLDLTKVSADKMKKYKQIWAFSTDEMNSSDQQTLVDYTIAGGNLIVFPYLPDREMSQKPCTIIRDALSVSPSGVEATDSPLIDVFDLKDIKCANPQSIFSENSLIGTKVIARTIQGSVCGFTKKLGSGSLTHLGAWIGFDTEGHKPVYNALLKLSGAQLRQASSTNENITIRERFTNDNSALLFIANYYNEDHMCQLHYTHPDNGETISIPYLSEEILMPALYSILTPICMQVDVGLKILHSTSDILNINTEDKQLQITLFGNRDLPGEIVFEGESTKKISSASVDGEPTIITHKNNRVICKYTHKHKIESNFTIYFN